MLMVKLKLKDRKLNPTNDKVVVLGEELYYKDELF